MSGRLLRSSQLFLLLILLAGFDVTTAPNAATSPSPEMNVCAGSSRYQCAQSCYERGSRLVVIKDMDTNNRVRDLLSSSKIDKAYVGMDDQAREGYFQRSDGSIYVKEDFSRWASASGRPEQANEGDDCVTVDTDGNWRVESCTLLLPSLCEALGDRTKPVK